MSFASSLYFLYDCRPSVCPLDGSKLGSWSSFCPEPVLSCFSTLAKLSLVSSVVEVLDTRMYTIDRNHDFYFGFKDH